MHTTEWLHVHMYMMTSRVPINERRSVHAARSWSSGVTVVTPPHLDTLFLSSVATITEQLYPTFTSGASDFTRHSDARVTVQWTQYHLPQSILFDTTFCHYILCLIKWYRDSNVIRISSSLWNVDNLSRMLRF